MASTYLKRDLSVSETIYKWTWSAWIKRTGLGVAGALFKSRADSNNWVQAYFDTSNKLVLQSYKNGGYHYDFRTVRVFRDTNSWYHFVINVDSSQSTASDRVRIYVNGEQLSNYTNHSGGSTVNNLTNGDSLIFNTSDSGTGHTIGSWNAGTYFDGCMSHVHYSSGYSYAPTVFGSTDATTGEWKIDTNPTFTLGGNGYTVLKDGNTITDQSSNSNDFTVGGGTLTKTEDNPSNVFATLNPLSTDSGVTLSSGNTESDFDGSVGNAKGTLGFSSGKFYWEAKIVATTGSYPMIGIGSLDEEQMQKPTGGSYPGGFTNSYGGYGNGSIYANGSNTGSQSFTWGANDIIGIAVDLDSGTKTIKWFKNGSQIATYNITTVAPFTSMDYNGAESAVNIQYNFGNGYFGTTAVSSAGTNASNLGIFEYDVPSGYTALCTKGLNE